MWVSMPQELGAFQAALAQVCRDLADDVVRNGEGTNHVIAVTINGAPSEAFARDLGRTVVNSPLVKCAVAGNDPNVGRLVGAVGKFVGNLKTDDYLDSDTIAKRFVLSMGGYEIFRDGKFQLSLDVEEKLVAHMKAAELGDDGSATFPAHKRRVEICIELGLGEISTVVLGSDLTREYVNVNADYRS